MVDFTLFMYASTSLISFAGFILFYLWWWEAKGATVVYAYLTLLFGSESIIYFMESINRYSLKMDNIIYFLNLYLNQFWGLKFIFHLLILSFIVFSGISHLYNVKKRIKIIENCDLNDKKLKEEIMIVDDKIELRNLIKKNLLLSFPNLIIHEAHNAESALKIFNENKMIDLIITDLYLPKMSGFDLCRILKHKCPWVIVIAMTGYPLIYELYKAREIGFDDYIKKPFYMQEIISIVKREIEKVIAWRKIKNNTIDQKGES